MVGPHHHQPPAFTRRDRREGGFELLPHIDALGRAPFAFDVLRREDVGAAFDALAIDDPAGPVGGHRRAAEFDDFRAGPSIGATAEISA